MDFTSEGRNVISISDSKIYIWSGLTGQLIGSMDHSMYLWSVAISSDGSMAASGADQGSIKLWNLKTGKEIYTLIHDNNVWNTIWSLAFSPDNTILVSGDMDANVTGWDIQTGKELFNLVNPNGVSSDSLAFSPDGKILAIGTDYRIDLWDTNSKKLIRTLIFDLRGGEGFSGIQGVLFSPDGKEIAAADGDNIAMVWEVSSGKKMDVIVGKGTFIRESKGALAFTADGKMLAVGNDNGSIIFWDVFTNKELRTIGSEKCIPLDLNFGFDGKLLEIGCYNGTIQLWGIP